jgi:hypothetical protein
LAWLMPDKPTQERAARTMTFAQFLESQEFLESPKSAESQAFMTAPLRITAL